MRALVLVMLLVGCGHGKHPAVDASTGDAIDGDAGSCEPTGLCPAGPACGSGCCGAGEHCKAGVCMCASNPACQNGDMCNAGGGVEPTQFCGALCCGGVTPCPI